MVVIIKKQNIITLCVFYGLLLIGNMIPVLVNIEDAQITKYSVPAIAVMTFVIFNGVLSFFLRHKGNYLIFKKHRANEFGSDKGHTFSEEYQKRFFKMLGIYCAAIPFYIPLIFLLTSYIQTLWVLVVFFVPQAIFIVQEIEETEKKVKEAKIRCKQIEEELKEQQKREELGYYK